MANELVKYNPSVSLVEQTIKVIAIDDLEELNTIQDKAAALREGARQARQPKIVWNYFMATAIWARWKIGMMLPGIVQHGGDHKSESRTHDGDLKTLCLDDHEADRWRLLARIGEDGLREHIGKYDSHNGKGGASTLTFSGCYKLLPKPRAPKGTYDVIVIDPPWETKKIARDDRPNQTDGVGGKNKGIEEMDYAASMKETEIIEWGDANLNPAPDCHVFLWTTQRYLPASFRILEAWKLKYICTFVWHKPGGFQPIGLPQYNCEFILYARKGTPTFASTKSLPVCFSAPRGGHSEKPDAFYEMIERCTTGKRIDMFARKKRKGFEIWGDEV